MTDPLDTLQVILQDAGYRTRLTPFERKNALAFEDDAVMGFAYAFDDPSAMVADWQAIESAFLRRDAVRLQGAGDKAWNVYSVFLCSLPADDEQARQIRQIEEQLERTRKIAACGLISRQDFVSALLPLLPLQQQPLLDSADLPDRLAKRIASIAPGAEAAALDENVTPEAVVRLLGVEK
jgi:hypothetical protein